MLKMTAATAAAATAANDNNNTKREFITQFFKCLDADEKHYLLEQKLDQLRRLDGRLVDLREEFCYYVASSEPLTREERRQILWLIEPNTSDDYVTVSDCESHLRCQQRQARQLADPSPDDSVLVEIGPRLSYCTPFSTNSVSILRSSCPQTSVYRLERSTLYQLTFGGGQGAGSLSEEDRAKLIGALHDEMVETVYESPVGSFHPEAPRARMASGEAWLQPCAEVDILGGGELALRRVSQALGLFFDDWDINYYVNLFRDSVGRNPTVVECFDLAQSNSEHSRHWFFKGLLDIEGRAPSSKSLIDMVASTQKHSNPNNVIKFEDNSSAIRGFEGLHLLAPERVDVCAPMRVSGGHHRHIIFTAETHNFPTGVAPFPGAATGTGGRIRDVQATGRGAHVIAGTAGYSFGNLLLDDHELDWENPHELYPNNLAPPSRIAVEASNGASDYGNKFGEPIVAGFARSFGLRLVAPRSKSTERWEYLKPIMFTGGLGTIDHDYTQKLRPEAGMRVAKVGGPVYRIGIGGGAASSASGVGASAADQAPAKRQAKLDFNAVQRGDPEMEQKLNRVIRACIENRADLVDDKGQAEYNPILSIHDQGAGGNGNVLKEIVDPLGTTIEADRFTLGDHTVNILELWAAEYQESDAILACPSARCQQLLDAISAREKCRIDFVGQVEDSGQIRLQNFADEYEASSAPKSGADEARRASGTNTRAPPPGRQATTAKQQQQQQQQQQQHDNKRYPIDLKLEHVIGSMPRKVFKLADYSPDEYLAPAKLIETAEEPPRSLKSRYSRMMGRAPVPSYILSQNQMMNNFDHLLRKVLRLPSVASKRYLTTKVDRCVTGLIAGQQCLGPLHTPIGDYALVALSHFELRGAVTAIGEQPIKGLVSPVSNATMSVAEALTNLMFCRITALEDVKCSANWMWAAKLPGEGAKLLDACDAMCKLMAELGIAVDGGKDSLSMSATVDPANSRRIASVLASGGEGGEGGDAEGDGDQDEDEDDDAVEVVKSPGTLVISAYAPVPDIRCKVTPILRCRPKRSHLIYVNLAHPVAGNLECQHNNKFRLGGSAILQTLGQIGDEAPNIDHPELLRDGFKLIQALIGEGTCTAGHDVSDGGLIVCVLEMALASHCGVHLNIQAEKSFSELGCANNDERILGALFAEECGVVVEVEAGTEAELNGVLQRFEELQIQAQRIGFGSYENQRVTVKFEQQLLLEYENNHKLRDYWESTSRQLDLRQANRRCVAEEYDGISSRPNRPAWRLTFDPNKTRIVAKGVDFDGHYLSEQPRVAVLREEGINGDREMIASLAMAGFQVYDVTVTDLTERAKTTADLSTFDGLVFPGGFSYSDVFGSGRGWAASLIFNDRIRQQLIRFRRRPNTFSLGVCNGCQLMALLGFLDELPDVRSNKLIADIPATTVRLEHNDSGRFECRFVNVCIETTTNSIMLRDMEDSSFGVWVAHGEGKFKIEQSVEVDSETRIALRYVDDKNEPTMEYPLNPNGSDQSIAGLCSPDGRHLAMMPHPERCTQLWQWPYLPPEWAPGGSQELTVSPWMQMFVNAYEFCKYGLSD